MTTIMPSSANDAPAVLPQIELRDYFAIHADLSKLEFLDVETLAKFVGYPDPSRLTEDMELLIQVVAKAMAKARYIHADAMLKARKDSPNV